MISLSTIIVAACVGLVQGFAGPPQVAIVIDDIGYHYENGRAAVEMPLAFSYAVLPFSPHAKSLAHLANSLEKDVIVHLPMEADHDNHLLGPGALRIDMSRSELTDTFLESLSAVPHAIGINNHMGSRLTREPSHMRWLMQAIHARGGLFFIDSRTTSGSVALYSAHQEEIASTARDIFLDNIQIRWRIEEQLQKLVVQAKRDGHALGIAHPHPLTIDVLSNWQPSMSGVRVIQISTYIAAYQSHTELTPRAAKPLGLASTECRDKGDNADTAQNPYTQR